MISMGWVAGNDYVCWGVPFVAGVQNYLSFGGVLQSANASHWNGF